MPVQDKLGENDGLDSAGPVEDVAYETTETNPDTPEEKSDAQRIADGEITVNDSEDEMFVTPNSVFKPTGGSDKKKTPDEKKDAKPEAPAPGDKKDEPEKPAGEKPAEEKKPEEEKKPAAAPDPVQKRINKITREKYEATRKAEAEKARADKAEEELRKLKQSAAKTELEAKKPKAEDFEDVEQYHVALGRWAAKLELQESKSQEVEKPETPKKDTGPIEDPVKKVIDLGQETYDDFLEVVGQVPLTKETFEVAQDSDHAVEILYHIGQNPETAKKLAAMKSPVAIAREIGRIEALYIVPEVKSTEGGEDSELPLDSQRPKPPPPKVTKAPAPVKPVGSSGKVSQDLDQAAQSIATYRERRGFTRDGMKKKGG